MDRRHWLRRLLAPWWRLRTRLRVARREGPIPYSRPRQPLARLRVALITTAGVYRRGQPPFAVDNPAGDWSMRPIAADTAAGDLLISHTHYDTRAAVADPDCVFPLRRLHELVAAGEVGSVSPVHFGLMGYIPDPAGLVRETAPVIARTLRAEGVHAAALSPG